MAVLYAFIAVLAWGVWLAPSQNVKISGQQTRTFYVSAAVLLLAILASLFVGLDGLNFKTFWYPFVGGIIWTVSGWSAFVGTKNLGMAKAFGIWAPMNIAVSIFWGMVLFGEFLEINAKELSIAVLSFGIMIVGILLIIFSGKNQTLNTSDRSTLAGLLGAMGAGVGFATYFVPITWGTKNAASEFENFNMWVGTLPLAVGMFVGSIVLMLLSRSNPSLSSRSDYVKVMSTGFLWGIGNYGALALVDLIGAGKGFSIAQLCVVVNALIGIFIFKEPLPNSAAARRTLLGVTVAIVGGVILMNFETLARFHL